MPFNPSPYQQAVFNFIRDARGSAVVTAVAGSGKSTTVLNCLPLIQEGKHVQLLAFNKSIADDLNGKLDAMRKEHDRPFRNVSARTFHALALGALTKFLGGKPVIDSRKLSKLFEAQVSAETFDTYSAFVTKLVGLARGEGIGALMPDTDAVWFALIAHHDLTLDVADASEDVALQLARALLTRSNFVAKNDRLIDFDDMLYLPVLWGLKLWQNDFVFVDEAQDTNPIRRALLKLVLRPGGRLIAVGDARQAIYGFTGASHDAIDLIKREFNATDLPLTVSYRCAQSIIARAQSIVPYLEAHADAPLGLVEEMPIADAIATLDAHDAVLCRQTAPLLSLAYQLIARKVRCVVLGREIGAGLVSLVKAQRARTIDALIDRLSAYRDREVAKFTAKGQEAKAEGVSDRVDCVMIVIDNLPQNRDRTVGKLIQAIESLFSDANGALTLCTVHKAKGREWDRVAVLRPDLMPSKWARQEWQFVQEENLMYVAWTRAKRHLIFLQGELK
jgi:DNA helicase-2/ATP-dependent DNA helicase PcrA